MRTLLAAKLMLALALVLFAYGGVARAQTFVGVVEETWGGVFPEVRGVALRVAFVHDANGWRAAEPTAPSGPWTIGFDGREVGQFSSGRTIESRARNLVAIANERAVPRIGETREEFSGWASMSVHRPLVATTSGHVADPEQWRRASLTADQTTRLRRAFRAQFPHVDNCANPYENVARPWRYDDSAIAIAKSYVSNKDWRIATIQLAGYNCDGMIYGTEFDDQVFAISPEGETRFLGDGIWLVDAGDYDGDGASELIFFIDRYNRGGYELFSADFSAHAVFTFGYH